MYRCLSTLVILFVVISLKAFAQHPCPPQGDDTSKRIQKLDVKKNRTTGPASVDASITTEKILSPGADANRFSIDSGAEIDGYIQSVNPEGGESCNCHSLDSVDYDYHLYFAKEKGPIAHTDCMIIEITPASRKLHPEWTEPFLNALIGKKVKVAGWMLYDFMHKSNSIRDTPHGAKLWRNTCWEVHPVTSISVLP